MKKEIRILVLFGSPFLYGSEKANIDMLLALNKFEHVKIIFLVDKERSKELVQPYLKEKSLDFIPVSYHFMLRKNMKFSEWFIKLKEITEGSYSLIKTYLKFKPTHIYTSKQEYFFNFFPALYFINKPLIYRIGDSPVLHNVLHKYVWSQITKKASTIVCVSKFIENEVLLSSKSKIKTDVIYSKPHERNTFSKKNKDTDYFNILYVGQIAKHKGVDLLVNAAIKLCTHNDNIKVHIIGGIDLNDTFIKELVSSVKTYNLEDKIRFLGYQSDVDSFYKSANLHICPSVYNEPLANVLIDAKNFSIPSIIFSVGGLPEIINDGIDGIVCKDKTSSSLEKEILELYLNQKRCKEMGEKAFMSLENLKINEFSERWLNVFETTI